MRIVLFAVAALALAACNPATTTNTTDTASTQAANGCAASAEKVWDAGAAGMFTIVANVAGADCGSATATLVVRNARGEELLSENFPVDQVMVLAGSTGVADMQAKITDWIDDAGKTSSELADWPRGAQSPMLGEFAFYTDEGVTRDQYLAARAANAPMLMLVQGMESSGCWVLQNGHFMKLGAQSFPG